MILLRNSALSYIANFQPKRRSVQRQRALPILIDTCQFLCGQSDAHDLRESFWVGFQAPFSACRGSQAALKCSNRSDSVTQDPPVELRARTAHVETRKGLGCTGRALPRKQRHALECHQPFRWLLAGSVRFPLAEGLR